MKPMSASLGKPYSYAEITQHCYDQIAMLMSEARHQTGSEAAHRYERAYGVYMGWRTLVAEHTEPGIFFDDDRRLEALLVSRG